MKYVTHYLINGGPRCGQVHFRNATISPEKVTCRLCKEQMKGTLQ